MSLSLDSNANFLQISIAFSVFRNSLQKNWKKILLVIFPSLRSFNKPTDMIEALHRLLLWQLKLYRERRTVQGAIVNLNSLAASMFIELSRFHTDYNLECVLKGGLPSSVYLA